MTNVTTRDSSYHNLSHGTTTNLLGQFYLHQEYILIYNHAKIYL